MNLCDQELARASGGPESSRVSPQQTQSDFRPERRAVLTPQPRLTATLLPTSGAGGYKDSELSSCAHATQSRPRSPWFWHRSFSDNLLGTKLLLPTNCHQHDRDDSTLRRRKVTQNLDVSKER